MGAKQWLDYCLRRREKPRQQKFMLKALKLFGLALAAMPFWIPLHVDGQSVIHVPGDVASLQAAIDTVPDGGVIELAAGSYNAPSGGFTIYDPARGFTIRAAQNAGVLLDGYGSTDIVRVGNHTNGTGRVIIFERLTFANGLTNSNFLGGAMTLASTDAAFINCTFQNNAADPSLTGGGALWIDTSNVAFQSCKWVSNRSKNYGGAMSVLNSTVSLLGCEFTDNRTNHPGHSTNSAGGAMLVNGSTVRIAHCRFENNQSGYVAGAIYALGHWQDPLSTPAVDLQVTDSLFIGNVAQRDPSVNFPPPAAGGAIHVEDQTTAKFSNCRFLNNVARQGGAVSSYRAITEFDGCVFKNNQATGANMDESLGGAIIILSSDNVDPSTDYGTINRRTAQLIMRDSLIQGTVGQTSARQGGGIFASGDLAAAFGIPPFAQNGTPESNHAVVNLTRVAFSNLIAPGDLSQGTGNGAAFMGDFATLNADNIIVENCNATSYGGGFKFGSHSTVNINSSTIAQNTSGAAGAALTMFGGVLSLDHCNIVGNQISGANGAAIVSGPIPAGGGIPAADMNGLIQNCVFSNNSGGATIYDGEGYPSTGPFNRLQYSSNLFFGASHVLYSDVAGSNTVPQLNTLRMSRPDGSVTVKAPAANTVPTSAPVVGALLMVPKTVLQSGAVGEPVPIAADLVYAFNGAGASLDGATLSNPANVVPTSVDGVHTLIVGGASFATAAAPPGVATNIATRLPVGTGQNVLIAGFIIQGPAPKRVLVRAVGPSIASLPGTLKDPVLELHDSTTGATIANNDNWRFSQIGGAIGSNQVVEVLASGLAPTDNAEPAIIATLNPGPYTAVVQGAAGGTGVAVVQVYDLDSSPVSTLANISTRGFVQTGDNVMFGGFIIQGGAGPTKIVVRGLGPSLAASGITNPVSDPALEVYNGNGALVSSNDNWADTQRGEISALGFQPSSAAESAILFNSLARGAYTAILRGKNGTGIGLIEVYVFQ